MKNLVFVTLLVAVLLVAGCTQGTNETTSGGDQTMKKDVKEDTSTDTSGTMPNAKTVKFGAILPLTGTLANLGEGMRDAMLLAVEDVNKEGKLNLELVVEDTACDPGNAVPAVNKLVSVDHVSAIAGPTCSGESFSTSAIVNDNKVPTVSPSATNAKLSTDAGDYWFRVSPSDAFQGRLMADYAKQELGAKRAAVLYLNNDWGLGLKDEFVAEFKKSGGQIAITETIEPDTTDVRTQLTKIRALNSDLIYMPCFPKECAVALKQMSDMGIKTQVLGADGADDPATLATLGNAANGFTLTVPSGAGEEFNAKFKAKYGTDAGAYAAQSYDAVMVLAKAAAETDGSGEAMKGYLYTVDYDGVTGEVKFDSNGDVTSAKYDLKKWEDGKFTLLKQLSG